VSQLRQPVEETNHVWFAVDVGSQATSGVTASMEGKQKMMTGAGNKMTASERHGNRQEGPIGDWEKTGGQKGWPAIGKLVVASG
jgi:hypothetical protein